MFNKFKNRLQGYPEDLSGKLKKDEEPYKPADLDKMTAGLVETENFTKPQVVYSFLGLAEKGKYFPDGQRSSFTVKLVTTDKRTQEDFVVTESIFYTARGDYAETLASLKAHGEEVPDAKHKSSYEPENAASRFEYLLETAGMTEAAKARLAEQGITIAGMAETLARIPNPYGFYQRESLVDAINESRNSGTLDILDSHLEVDEAHADLLKVDLKTGEIEIEKDVEFSRYDYQFHTSNVGAYMSARLERAQNKANAPQQAPEPAPEMGGRGD